MVRKVGPNSRTPRPIIEKKKKKPQPSLEIPLLLIFLFLFLFSFFPPSSPRTLTHSNLKLRNHVATRPLHLDPLAINPLGHLLLEPPTDFQRLDALGFLARRSPVAALPRHDVQGCAYEHDCCCEGRGGVLVFRSIFSPIFSRGEGREGTREGMREGNYQ